MRSTPTSAAALAAALLLVPLPPALGFRLPSWAAPAGFSSSNVAMDYVPFISPYTPGVFEELEQEAFVGRNGTLSGDDCDDCDDDNDDDDDDEDYLLLKRSNSCPKNYDSCSALGAADAGICCSDTQTCTLDAANHVACCSIGAQCTGTIAPVTPATNTATTTTGSVFGFGGSTGTTATTTTSTSTSTGSSSPIATGTPTYVAGAPFPFPIIPTTYANSVSCLSAWTACTSNFAACTSDLGGGAGAGFAVTVVAPGQMGTTVAPGASLGASSAASVCSSLSNAACYGLQSADCAQFGSAGAVQTFDSGSSNAGAGGWARPPMPTAACARWAAVAAGVGVVAGLGGV